MGNTPPTHPRLTPSCFWVQGVSTPCDVLVFPMVTCYSYMLGQGYRVALHGTGHSHMVGLQRRATWEGYKLV